MSVQCTTCKGICQLAKFSCIILNFSKIIRIHPKISTCPGFSLRSLTVFCCVVSLLTNNWIFFKKKSLCVFRMPWVLHQMPGGDPIPVSYSHHLAVCGRGSVLRLRTWSPVWHSHHPPELLWGGAEPCGCTGRLHHVSWKRSHWIKGSLWCWRKHYWP